MRDEITSAAEAVAVIQDGDALCTSGFVGIGVPEQPVRAQDGRFVDTRSFCRLLAGERGHL